MLAILTACEKEGSLHVKTRAGWSQVYSGLSSGSTMTGQKALNTLLNIAKLQFPLP